MAIRRDTGAPSKAARALAKPYQQLLRSVGFYLDLRSASQISVVEDNDRFLVRYQSYDHREEEISVVLSIAELTALEAEGKSRRSQPGIEPTGRDNQRHYEDILRAMGYELELLSAHAIIVDEVDRSFTLTYHYVPPHDTATRKHRTTIRPNDAELILRDARLRRRLQQPG